MKNGAVLLVPASLVVAGLLLACLGPAAASVQVEPTPGNLVGKYEHLRVLRLVEDAHQSFISDSKPDEVKKPDDIKKPDVEKKPDEVKKPEIKKPSVIGTITALAEDGKSFTLKPEPTKK